MERIVYTVAVVFLCSCSKIAQKAIIGTTTPKDEDKTSISAFLKKEKINGDKVFSVTPDSFFIASTYLMFGVLIFDKAGNHVSFGEEIGKYCFKELPDSIAALQTTGHKFLNYAVSKLMNYSHKDSAPSIRFDTIPLHLLEIGNKFYDLDGHKIQYKRSDVTDYVIVFPFALYYGSKMQTKEIRRYIKAVERNKTARFEIVLLNLDKQKWWGDKANKVNFDVK